MTKRFISRIIYRLKTHIKFFRLRVNKGAEREIIDNFHKLYYDSNLLGKTWASSKFLETPVQKCPFDLFVYQEIVCDIKPDVIVECGTAYGGTAIFLASICDLINHGKIITIDITDLGTLPEHPKIQFINGSSTSQDVFKQVKNLIKEKDKVMVILDSDHSKEHVLKELHMYSTIVSEGSYLIVEDSNVNGHPVWPEHGPGPMEAIEKFMSENKDFTIDSTRESQLLTFNPRGYLKKLY